MFFIIQILDARILTTKDRQTASYMCIEHGNIVCIGGHIPEGYKAVDCVDMGGRVITPGIIDAHSHLASCANAFRQADLSNARSFVDIRHILTDFIQRHHLKEQDWVNGVDYGHMLLKEHRHPDADVLRAIGRRPIVVTHASSHMDVASYTAMQLADIPPGIPNPIDGEYGRNTDGMLNGYIEGNAFTSFLHRVPVPSIEKVMRPLGDTLQLYASYGITTIQDRMMNATVYAILKKAAVRSILKQDIVDYVGIRGSEALREESRLKGVQYHKHFRIGGHKMFLDDSPQGRTAWVQTPYQGDANYYGYGTMSSKEVAAYIRKSLLEHQQLLARCNGDIVTGWYLAQSKKIVRELDAKDTLRPIVIHARLVQRERLERMKSLQMIPSFFATHVWHWRSVYIENFEIQRVSPISPLWDVLQLGLMFTLYTNTPVIAPNLMESVWCAAIRRTKDGMLLGEKECINVYETLRAITRYAAQQYHEEDQKGTLEAGRLADLAALDQDPLEIPMEEIQNIQVLETWKEGTCVYRRRAQESQNI